MAGLRHGGINLWIVAALSGLAFSAIAGAQTPPDDGPATTQPEAVQPQSAQPQAAAPDDGDVADAIDTLDLTGLQSRFQAIADKVSDSVVAISAVDGGPGTPGLPSSELNPQRLQDILDENTRTVGTGFVVGADGWILTNEHVIGQAKELWITTSDHKVWPALVAGSDPRADLAALKIPATGLKPVSFATDAEGKPSAAAVRRGEWSIALGNPYGLAIDGQSCMSVGVISALDRSLQRLAAKEDRLYSRLLETTAQINPGNSGGPLFDLEGRVIGINTAVILPQKQTNGVGFAIPVTQRLIDEVHDLEQGRPIVYGYLGVTVDEPTERQRQAAGAEAGVGVRVTGSEPDTPAAALLRPDDMLVKFDGHALHDADEFVRTVGAAQVGKGVKLELRRDGLPLTVEVAPERRPMELAAITRETERLKWRGMLLGPLPLGARGVQVVALDEDSPMKKRGVRQGSIIQSVAGHGVDSLIEMLAVMNGAPAGDCAIGLAASSAAVPAAATQPPR